MKIVRIKGDRATGKTTVLKAFRDALPGQFLELTGYDLKLVKQRLDGLAASKHLETRVTVFVDDCQPAIEDFLDAYELDNVTAVVALPADSVRVVLDMEMSDAPPDKAAVMNLAHHLTQVAEQAGLIVTIERLPLKPLAMGNCCYEIATYPVRGVQ